MNNLIACSVQYLFLNIYTTKCQLSSEDQQHRMFLPQIFNVYFPYTDNFGNEAQVMKWLLPSKVYPKKKSVLGIVLCIMQPYRQVSLIRKMILNVSPPVQQASTLESIICGHHIYKHTWQPLVGGVLTLE